MPNKMISYGRQSISAADIVAVTKALKSDFLTQGPAVREFEAGLSNVVGAKHALACSNGTTALHLAALALDVGPNTVGFVPSVTFSASLTCLYMCNVGGVELVDVDATTGLMDLESLERALKKYPKKKKKVIVVVSLQGASVSLKRVAALARKYGAKVIEDAAHSLGGQTPEGDNSASCKYTDLATMSFHPVKHITTAEGGVVFTNSEKLAKRVALLRSHGIIRPMRKSQPAWYYEQIEVGYNYRMSDLQAALGASQLKRLGGFIKKRRAVAKRYDKALGKGLLAQHLRISQQIEGSAYHLYCVHFASQRLRNDAWAYLRENGFNTQVFYVPLHHFPTNIKRLGKLKLPGADAYYEGTLALPIFPDFKKGDQQRLLGLLEKFFAAKQSK